MTAGLKTIIALSFVRRRPADPMVLNAQLI
jgi:hypothetical protein